LPVDRDQPGAVVAAADLAFQEPRLGAGEFLADSAVDRQERVGIGVVVQAVIHQLDGVGRGQVSHDTRSPLFNSNGAP
jgi:hypothetical protein